MQRAHAYEALTAVLQTWRDLPLADLLARLNQVSVDTVWRDGWPIEVEVCARWKDTHHQVVLHGSACEHHTHLSRIDEHIEIPVSAPNFADPCRA